MTDAQLQAAVLSDLDQLMSLPRFRWFASAAQLNRAAALRLYWQSAAAAELSRLLSLLPAQAAPTPEILTMHDDLRAAFGPHLCARMDAAAPGWLSKLIDALPSLIAILMPIFLEPTPPAPK